MYALFSQQKLVYQGLLASAQTELMNITHAHENLAMRNSDLKSRLATLQEQYGNEKSDLYDQLASSISNDDYDILSGKTDGSKKTGHKKVNNKEGLTDSTASQSVEYYSKLEWLALKYGLVEYDDINDGTDLSFDKEYLEEHGLCLRSNIEDELKRIEDLIDVEEARINKQIDEVALKETRLDTEKASIETKITDYQKQLEKIEEAEGKGIEASIGKFQGVG